jgi:hypothetical protein
MRGLRDDVIAVSIKIDPLADDDDSDDDSDDDDDDDDADSQISATTLAAMSTLCIALSADESRARESTRLI